MRHVHCVLPDVHALRHGIGHDGCREVLEHLCESVWVSSDQVLLRVTFPSDSIACARPSHDRRTKVSVVSYATSFVSARARCASDVSRTHLVLFVVVQEHVCHVVELGFAVHRVDRCAPSWRIDS